MASAQSIRKGQFPITCQLCETGGKIQWKCMDCELLMCQRCYDKIHPKFKNSKDHKIENISQVGKKPVISSVQLKVTRKFETELKVVHYMCSCPDGSVWISDTSTRVLCQVKFDGEKLEFFNKFDMAVYGIATTPSNILFVTPDSNLKQFNVTTNQIINSKYTASPLKSFSICLSHDNKIIVGAIDADFDGTIPIKGRRALVIMDLEGHHISVIEHDKNKDNILSFPNRVICTKNGNIFVVDRLSPDHKGRIVVISQEGDSLRTYNGYPDLSTETEPFKPTAMAVSPSDTVIVCESYMKMLHILDNLGNFVTVYSTRSVGIERPYSLAFTNTGKLLIGCSIKSGGGSGIANMYDLEYSEH